MSRTMIELPDRFAFSTSYTVVMSDINYGMHLAADRMLPIALEAQGRFLAHLGHDPLEGIEGYPIIMVDCEMSFLSESYHGDTLSIEVAVNNFGRCSFEFLFRFSKQGKGKTAGLEVARIKAGMLFFNTQERQVMSVPTFFKEQCLALNGG